MGEKRYVFNEGFGSENTGPQCVAIVVGRSSDLRQYGDDFGTMICSCIAGG